MKARRLVFHRHVADDLAEAVRYLDDAAAHLGDQLLAAFEEKLALIARHPDIYVANGAGIRRANLDRFSYSLRFSWRDETIYVLAFAHHRQDSERWLERLHDLLR